MRNRQRGPKEIIAGGGAIEAVPAVAARFGHRALLVADPAVVEAPACAAVIDRLRSSGEVTVFVPRDPELPMATVDECVSSVPATPDVVIGIGGGAVLDLAKVSALLLTHGGEVRDYFAPGSIPGRVLPLIAAPTTSGTGSEVTPIAVVSDPDGMKVGLVSPHLVPDIAVCDPALTHSCPPSVSAFAGIDAVCHAVEAFTAPIRPDAANDWTAVTIGKNEVSDDDAIRALSVLATAVPRVVAEPDDAEARAAAMAGATQAGFALATAGVGVAHALQYTFGGATKTPHGLGVGLLLPYVLDVLRPELSGELDQLMACVADSTGAAETDFVTWLRGLNAAIGLPPTLAEIGVQRADIPSMAAAAAGMPRLVGNSRGPGTAEFLTEVLERAYAG